MAEPAAWGILDEALHADCKVFQVLRQRCKHPHDSREGDFFVIRCSDWVLALPVTRDGRLVLVRQYRFGTTIAKAHGVTLAALTAANPGVNFSKLKIGQIIKIPAKK